MRIRVWNLGAIRHVELDMRPLTVLVGPNSTGKSWLAYTLGAVFGRHGWQQHLDLFMKDQALLSASCIHDIMDQLRNRGRASFALDFLAESLGPRYFQSVAESARMWIPEYLGVNKATLGRFELQIEAKDAIPRIREGLQRTEVDFPIAFDAAEQAPLLQMAKDGGDAALHVYSVGSADPFEALPETTIRRQIARQVFQILHRTIYIDSYVFPTERTAYVALPMVGESFVRESHGGQVRIDRSDRPMALPIAEFLGWMGRSYFESTRRDLRPEENPSIASFNRIADLLESSVMQGHLSLGDLDSEMKELRFEFGEDQSVAIGSASSMVKELAPLVQYLRNLALPRDLLVIDEPEMNLHPAAQVAMTELLAMLANSGQGLILTTHSPYFVDHLTNLIHAFQVDPAGARSDLLFLKDGRAYLDAENASICFINDGVGKDILGDDHLIDWETFSKVTERVSEIYFEL